MDWLELRKAEARLKLHYDLKREFPWASLRDEGPGPGHRQSVRQGVWEIGGGVNRRELKKRVEELQRASAVGDRARAEEERRARVIEYLDGLLDKRRRAIEEGRDLPAEGRRRPAAEVEAELQRRRANRGEGNAYAGM